MANAKFRVTRQDVRNAVKVNGGMCANDCAAAQCLKRILQCAYIGVRYEEVTISKDRKFYETFKTKGNVAETFDEVMRGGHRSADAIYQAMKDKNALNIEIVDYEK